MSAIVIHISKRLQGISDYKRNLQGSLAPGEATEIVLTIWVDGGQEGSAMLLTTKAAGKLDAILVLRVDEGNDIFCSINGNYMPSFFGLPLTLLAALPRYTNERLPD